MPGFYVKRWRVYIELMYAKYYAHEDPPTPLPRVRWLMKDQEYPEHFTWSMANAIASFYSDQKPTIETVMLNLEEEEVG